MNHKVLFSRAGVATQILVRSHNFIILFDVGDGIIRDLLRETISFPLSVPLHIFVSHGHYDHCAGSFSLLGFLRMIGNVSPVSIYFPSNSIEIEGLIELFLSIYSETIPFKLETQPLSPGDQIRILDDVQVLAIQMKHMGSTLTHGILPEIPALGYALYKGPEKLIAFTGDTGMNNNLPKLLRNATHAYIEATNPISHYSPYHLNLEEARELGKLAKAYTLIHTRK